MGYLYLCSVDVLCKKKKNVAVRIQLMAQKTKGIPIRIFLRTMNTKMLCMQYRGRAAANAIIWDDANCVYTSPHESISHQSNILSHKNIHETIGELMLCCCRHRRRRRRRRYCFFYCCVSRL